jgi:hypothetical protein
MVSMDNPRQGYADTAGYPMPAWSLVRISAQVKMHAKGNQESIHLFLNGMCQGM